MTMDYNTSNCVISVVVTDYDRSVAWYRDILGFDLVYELKEYGWCELKTPFTFNVGLGQTETVTPGNVTPTFGVKDIDAAIAHLREHDVQVEDWHAVATWSGYRPSTTLTGRRGCSRRPSTETRAAAASGARVVRVRPAAQWAERERFLRRGARA